MKKHLNTNLDLGRNILEARKSQNMSIKTLAKASKVTPSLISQIERGIANPSISTMKSIALALNKPLYDFFLPTIENGNQLISRANSHRRFIFVESSKVKRPNGYECELLTTKPRSNTTMLRIKLPPHSASNVVPSTHPEDETVFIEKGEVILKIGDSTEELYEHDSVSIPANAPHFWINETNDFVYLISCSARATLI